MLTQTMVYKLNNFEIEIRSFNRPDPHLAAQAILPLVLEMLDKQIAKERLRLSGAEKLLD